MARKILEKARRWERTTHQPGKHGGILGRAALSVLYALIYDFHNFKTGRLDPSVKTIAEKAAVCERTAYTALKRLRSLGLISWVRRCSDGIAEDGSYRLKQDTNAYQLNATSEWGVNDPPSTPPPHPDTLGFPTPVPDPLTAAATAAATGDRIEMMHQLTLDPKDELALALAELGRLIDQRS